MTEPEPVVPALADEDEDETFIENPTPEKCPTCGKSTTLASLLRDGGSTLYCAVCKPVRAWTSPDWELNEATGRMRRKPTPHKPTKLQHIATETMRRFRARHE